MPGLDALAEGGRCSELAPRPTVYNAKLSTVPKSNKNVVYDCTYHVTWCPKYRRSVITDEIGDRLKAIAAEVCAEHSATIIEIETMPDHVHLLVEIDPQYGIHRLVKQIKGRTSRLLRDEYPELRRRLPTLWTNSYYVATVGGAPLEVVKQYVADQRNK